MIPGIADAQIIIVTSVIVENAAGQAFNHDSRIAN